MYQQVRIATVLKRQQTSTGGH